MIPQAAEINPALKEEVFRRERECGGMDVSNVGGWHSERDFFSWEVPAVGVLQQAIANLVTDTMASVRPVTKGMKAKLRLVGWAMVAREGNYTTMHAHSGFTWSGVYYAASGGQSVDHPNSGQIQFVDPRGAVGMIPTPAAPFMERVMIEPEDGLLVLFPSWLVHWVHPFHGSEPRISIAFNVAFGETQMPNQPTPNT